jgi:hypothetical protein
MYSTARGYLPRVVGRFLKQRIPYDGCREVLGVQVGYTYLGVGRSLKYVLRIANLGCKEVPEVQVEDTYSGM